MKKQTKIKATAVAAVFTLATLIGTVVLVAIDHPAQWDIAGACMIAMIVTAFISVTITRGENAANRRKRQKTCKVQGRGKNLAGYRKASAKGQDGNARNSLRALRVGR